MIANAAPLDTRFSPIELSVFRNVMDNFIAWQVRLKCLRRMSFSKLKYHEIASKEGQGSSSISHPRSLNLHKVQHRAGVQRMEHPAGQADREHEQRQHQNEGHAFPQLFFRQIEAKHQGHLGQ